MNTHNEEVRITNGVPDKELTPSGPLTPLMQQFWSIKNQHKDKILLFRMGDFYEMFYDDAKTAAPILNIALTSRNKKSADETPMCGVPYHAISEHIGKLLNAGHKVAICDQLEDPETAKGIVKRGVTRILSPGMVYDPDSLAGLTANYVAAFDDHAVSFLEATTGECFFYKIANDKTANTANISQVNDILQLIRPTEIILTSEQKNFLQQNTVLSGGNFLSNDSLLMHISVFDFDTSANEDIEKSLHSQVVENSETKNLTLPQSAKRLLAYASHMQGPQILTVLKEFVERDLQEQIHLGANVLKHLEVFQSYRGEDRGSLFYAINRTKTSAGARELKKWLQFPLVQKNKIEARLNRVELWAKKPGDLKILRQTLAHMGDIERRLAKISYTNAHVRDLWSLSQSLRVGLSLTPLVDTVLPHEVKLTEALLNKIESTVVEDAPLNMKSGGYIRKNVNAELDELLELSENGHKMLHDLEARERETTQISSLKVRYNNVFGYYIEVTNTHREKVPDHYKRKQTLANAERYVTQELHELETKILSCRERRTQLEEIIFKELREQILNSGQTLLSLAAKWSELDVVSSLAWLSLEQKYVRPKFTQDNYLQIEGSRHPVVEQEVKKTFVPNHIQINRGDCLLLTGPNMAGKSTLMRQVAVTVLLAQIGSFVPATQAELPIFEKIYTRIGASDSLSEGLSTFMVEMKETAEMLAAADARTLVILDEVGRGTSTYDGMSLAQAILEFLITQAKSLTLFATHYHEITMMEDNFKQIHNAHMSIQESGRDIRFLYTLKSGPANKSYGIQVAHLAGLPTQVVERASELLATHQVKSKSDQFELPLLNFAATQDSRSSQSNESSQAHELMGKIKSFNALETSPLQALNQIVKWQQELS